MLAFGDTGHTIWFAMPQAPRLLLLFNHDWDAIGHARAATTRGCGCDEAGFDLFTFPSQLQLAWFDLERFVDRLARRARRRGWQGVSSQHEQFGALARQYWAGEVQGSHSFVQRAKRLVWRVPHYQSGQELADAVARAKAAAQ